MSMKITGTFITDSFTDIPDQNWEVKDWDRDYRRMREIGIDTTVLLRAGLEKIAYNDTVVVFSEMVNNDLGTSAFVNMKESGFSSGIRSDKGVGDFVITPTVDDAFTITTPVVTVNKASGSKFAVFKVFLNMFSSMVARQEVVSCA